MNMRPSARRPSVSVPVLILGGVASLLLNAPAGAQSVSALSPLADALVQAGELAVDSTGAVYVAGAVSDNLFRVDAAGTVTVLASPAVNLPADFVRPMAVAVDSADNVYVACGDSDNVFRFSSGGGVSVILDATGDGLGNALDAPESLVVDGTDGVWVAGFDSDNVFHVSSAGVVTLVLDAAGLGPGQVLDEPRMATSRGAVFILGISEVFRVGPGLAVTELIGPAGDGSINFGTGTDIEVDTLGNVFVSDTSSIFRIEPGGTITQVYGFFISFTAPELASDSLGSIWVTHSAIGTPTLTEIPSVGAAVNHISAGLGEYQSVAADGSGNVYWVQTGQVASDMLWRRAGDGSITPLIGQLGAGNGNWLLDGGLPLLLADGSIYVAGRASDNVLRVDPVLGPMSALAPPDWVITFPKGLAVDHEGRVLVTGASSANLVRVDPQTGDGEVLIDVSGDGMGNGYTNPTGVVVDSVGNVWTTGLNSDNLFRIAPDGTVTEMMDFTGDGVSPLDQPSLLAVDSQDNVYVAAFASDNVFKVSPDGEITEIINLLGDGAGHTLNGPESVGVDGMGNVYVAGRFSDNVFQITPGGVITQILDADGAGPGAELDDPRAVAVGWKGDVWVIGGATNNVLHVAPGGAITQVLDASGDGMGSVLTTPLNVHVDAFDTVYVSGWSSDNVLRLDSQGNVSVLADASGAGPANLLDQPMYLALNGSGTLYVGGGLSDNVLAVTQDDWWTDLGGAAPGIAGRPELRVTGPLTAASVMARQLSRVPPDALMMAWIAFASTPFDVLGGTVHAFPQTVQLFYIADATGASELAVPWPAGIPSGIDIYLQFIVQDLSVPAGLTLSNAVLQTTP